MSERPPPYRAPRVGSTFLDSLVHAWHGLIHTVVHQRNMRLHLIAALLVGQVGIGIPLGLAEKVTLIFCVLIIFFAEMLNSALEQLVDLAIQQFDEKARLTKDIGAAGVLVLAIGTVVIFAAIVVHNADTVLSNLDAVQRQALAGVPLVFCGGALMHEAKKPIVVDLALALGAGAAWALSLSWTESYVFSAMTLGLLVVAGHAALARQRGRRASASPSHGP